MAKWEHKEAKWHGVTTFGNTTYQIMLEDRELTVRNHIDGFDSGTRQQFLDKGISFTQWLDFQCLEGWEVFKISRDFSSTGKDTWCVFRRQV